MASIQAPPLFSSLKEGLPHTVWRPCGSSFVSPIQQPGSADETHVVAKEGSSIKIEREACPTSTTTKKKRKIVQKEGEDKQDSSEQGCPNVPAPPPFPVPNCDSFSSSFPLSYPDADPCALVTPPRCQETEMAYPSRTFHCSPIGQEATFACSNAKTNTPLPLPAASCYPSSSCFLKRSSAVHAMPTPSSPSMLPESASCIQPSTPVFFVACPDEGCLHSPSSILQHLRLQRDYRKATKRILALEQALALPHAERTHCPPSPTVATHVKALPQMEESTKRRTSVATAVDHPASSTPIREDAVFSSFTTCLSHHETRMALKTKMEKKRRTPAEEEPHMQRALALENQGLRMPISSRACSPFLSSGCAPSSSVLESSTGLAVATCTPSSPLVRSLVSPSASLLGVKEQILYVDLDEGVDETRQSEWEAGEEEAKAPGSAVTATGSDGRRTRKKHHNGEEVEEEPRRRWIEDKMGRFHHECTEAIATLDAAANHSCSEASLSCRGAKKEEDNGAPSPAVHPLCEDGTCFPCVTAGPCLPWRTPAPENVPDGDVPYLQEATLPVTEVDGNGEIAVEIEIKVDEDERKEGEHLASAALAAVKLSPAPTHCAPLSVEGLIQDLPQHASLLSERCDSLAMTSTGVFQAKDIASCLLVPFSSPVAASEGGEKDDRGTGVPAEVQEATALPFTPIREERNELKEGEKIQMLSPEMIITDALSLGIRDHDALDSLCGTSSAMEHTPDDQHEKHEEGVSFCVTEDNTTRNAQMKEVNWVRQNCSKEWGKESKGTPTIHQDACKKEREGGKKEGICTDVFREGREREKGWSQMANAASLHETPSAETQGSMEHHSSCFLQPLTEAPPSTLDELPLSFSPPPLPSLLKNGGRGSAEVKKSRVHHGASLFSFCMTCGNREDDCHLSYSPEFRNPEEEGSTICRRPSEVVLEESTEALARNSGLGGVEDMNVDPHSEPLLVNATTSTIAIGVNERNRNEVAHKKTLVKEDDSITASDSSHMSAAISLQENARMENKRKEDNYTPGASHNPLFSCMEITHAPFFKAPSTSSVLSIPGSHPGAMPCPCCREMLRALMEKEQRLSAAMEECRYWKQQAEQQQKIAFQLGLKKKWTYPQNDSIR